MALSHVVLLGDALARLRELPSDSVDCIVSSPPYWGLRQYLFKEAVVIAPNLSPEQIASIETQLAERKVKPWKRRLPEFDLRWHVFDYGDIPEFLRPYFVPAAQIGLEPTPQECVEALLDVFDEVMRVLKPSGSCWVNLGDTYVTKAGGGRTEGDRFARRANFTGSKVPNGPNDQPNREKIPGIKAKSLSAVPQRFMIGMIDRGYICRRDVVWEKSNPMPESCSDRFTTGHEYVFHFVKHPKYFWDKDAASEPCTDSSIVRLMQNTEAQQGSLRANGGTRAERPMKAVGNWQHGDGSHSPIKAPTNRADRRADFNRRNSNRRLGPGQTTPDHRPDREHRLATFRRNRRSILRLTNAKGPDVDHYATYPGALPKLLIECSCPIGGVVLDPFGGSGTTIMTAKELGRSGISIDISQVYVHEQIVALAKITPSMFTESD